MAKRTFLEKMLDQTESELNGWQEAFLETIATHKDEATSKDFKKRLKYIVLNHEIKVSALKAEVAKLERELKRLKRKIS